MKHKYIYLFLIFLFSIASIVFTLIVKGILSALILLIGIGIILFITRAVWRPIHNKFSVGVISLTTALTIVFSYGFWQNSLDAIVKTYFPEIAINYEYVPPLLVFLFISFVIWIVNYFNRDNTAMGKHPNPIEKDLPDISYEQTIKGIASSLSDDLRSIDIRTNWSSQYFTPLDAEVEIIRGNQKEKKIMDLLSAIKKSDDRLFLVLGDPGSGKSVSLRKLCQDLSGEVSKTGKIPVYINLKEWQIEQEWNEQNPPTTEHLMEFVLSNLKNRDIFINKFFNKKIDEYATCFDRLYQTGRLYFVFDSFDEIPSVLNENENSWLIKELSKVIFTFLKGTRQNSSQGILSSRLFRRPTREFQCNTILEIRPFSEKKIIKTLERNGKIDKSIIKDFFVNYSYLIPVARNPFTATLISEYIDSNNGLLPKTHAILYENYVDQLLENCKDRLLKYNLEKEHIISFAKRIAALMYKSNLGWEISVNQLRNTYSDSDIIIDILKFARIGRGNTGDDSIFSFVHRRFAEYFTVKNWLDDQDTIDLQAIPKDSQLRDALVLYCEVADNETATRIANFCWEIIDNSKDLQNIEVIHAIRFLRDAFISRKDCLAAFEKQLSKFVEEQISNNNNNMLSIKLVIECVGLLNNNNINKNTLSALKLENYWISETAFYSCRNLPRLSLDLEERFNRFFSNISIINLFKFYPDYNFSLSLSDAFKNILFELKFRLLDFYIFVFTILCVFCISPKYNTMILLISCIYTFIFQNIGKKMLKSKYNFFRLCYTILMFGITVIYLLKVNHNNSLNTDFSFWVIPILIFQIIYPIYILKKLLSKVKIKTLFARMLILIVVVLVVVLVSIYMPKPSQLFLNIILSILCVIGSFIIFINTKRLIINILDYNKERKILKRINIHCYTDRTQIYNQFTSFASEKIKFRFVRMLELYIHDVTGEWPDRDIFQITSKPANILLTQLEERWLGLGR